MFGSILCADEVHKKALRLMCHLIDWNTNQHGSPKTFTLEDINYITTFVKIIQICFLQENLMRMTRS